MSSEAVTARTLVLEFIEVTELETTCCQDSAAITGTIIKTAKTAANEAPKMIFELIIHKVRR
jgi:hypothetical protein